MRVAASALLLTLALALVACGSDTSEPRSVVPSDNAPAPATTQQTAPPGSSSSPATTAATSPSTTTAQPEPRTTPQRRPAQPRARTQTQTAQPDPAPAPRSATTPQPEPEPVGTPVDELAVLTLVERRSPIHYFQQGTVTGTFDGTMALEARVVARGVVVYFTATVEGGTITGKGLAIPTVGDSPTAELHGTAKITGGTGRFASIRGRRLTVGGKVRLDASRGRVRLTGTVTF